MLQKLMIVLVATIATACSYAQDNSNISFKPATPKQGDIVKFNYSTSGTTLGDTRDFDAVAYIYDGNLRAQEVTLNAVGNSWEGEIKTNDSTRIIYLVFKKDKSIDNNREQGYTLFLYKDGQPVKGAYLAKAEVNSGIGSYIMQLKTSPQDNLALCEKEFSRDASSKSKGLVTYANLLRQADAATAKEKIKPLIAEVRAQKVKRESDYLNIMYAYQRLGDKDAAAKLKKEIVAMYPKGMQVKNDKLDAIYNESDLKKREALLATYAKQYPAVSQQDKNTMDNLYASLASSAANKKDWALFKKYEGLVKNKENLAGAYNNVAWTLSGESLEAEAGDLPMAKELSGKSLEYLRKSMDNPVNKPTYYTEKEFRKNLQYSLGMYGDTYALILWKSGETENALKYQEEAIRNMNNSDNEANERYIVYKEKLKGPQSVKADIEEFVKDGKSSPKLKEILKKAFLADGHNDAEFDAYIEGLRKEYYARLREELAKKMIDEAAPKFALKDLSGNLVSLEELRGKVVVVDFWATWCGPCKASFPGMQTALTRYKDDPGVKFVFVDTWENKKQEEMQKNADEFISKNKYDFHVLLDTDDKVVGSYAVEGIPTKFVIDPQSKIRFKAIGYDGSADKLVDEISIMVDMLKTGGGEGKKGFK